MAEHPDLKVAKGYLKTEIPEHDLVHRELVLSKLRADMCINRRPHYYKTLLKTWLTAAMLDDSISTPTTLTVRRGNSSGLGAHPVQRGVINGVD